MYIRWLVVSSLFLSSFHAEACTVFESPFPGDTRYAHNVDWYNEFPDVRGVLVLNPANLQKHGELFGAPIPAAQWTSKYRSLSFSIAGAEFPVSGFNEKGLSMAILELHDSVYPPATDPRPALGVSQFVQYNLDRSVTLDDVIASDKVLRPYSSLIHMHYFVCEASAKCAVLQYVDGVLKVYRDQSLPYKILTNSLYPEMAKAADACLKDDNAPFNCGEDDTSEARFTVAANTLRAMDPHGDFDDQIWKALTYVTSWMSRTGTRTRYQMVFDPAARSVEVRKYKNTWQVGTLKVNFDEADCAKPRKVIEITFNATGDLSGQWQALTEDSQTDMAKKMGYPDAMAKAYGRLPFSFSCQKK